MIKIIITASFCKISQFNLFCINYEIMFTCHDLYIVELSDLHVDLSDVISTCQIILLLCCYVVVMFIALTVNSVLD